MKLFKEMLPSIVATAILVLALMFWLTWNHAYVQGYADASEYAIQQIRRVP